MTPIQGDWTISAIHLPEDVLRKVYFGNAERLLAKPLAKLRGGAQGLRTDAPSLHPVLKGEQGT